MKISYTNTIVSNVGIESRHIVKHDLNTDFHSLKVRLNTGIPLRYILEPNPSDLLNSILLTIYFRSNQQEPLELPIKVTQIKLPKEYYFVSCERSEVFVEQQVVKNYVVDYHPLDIIVNDTKPVTLKILFWSTISKEQYNACIEAGRFDSL